MIMILYYNMARCLPFPSPEYVLNGVSGTLVFDSMKVRFVPLYILIAVALELCIQMLMWVFILLSFKGQERRKSSNREENIKKKRKGGVP